MKRRDFLTTTLTGAMGAGIGLSATAKGADRSVGSAESKRYQNGRSPWPICLDTATIRPAEGLEKKVEIAARAGFDAIEPWDGELREYEASGGNLKDLGKRIRDLGLFVPSMIGLWGALQPTREAFEQSLDATRERMRMASDIGCQHVQTIPNELQSGFDYKFVAECYRRLVEIGVQDYNLRPALVFVEMFALKRLGQAAAIALDADHEDARIIPDVFHMYISEGGFNGLRHLSGDFLAIFQFNDAPKGMAREAMKDEHRVFPGDGILPLADILKDLKSISYTGCVSLELYNKTYWKGDLQEVAATGLRKTLEVIESSGV